MGFKQSYDITEVLATTLSGTDVLATNISGTTLAVGAGEVGNAELAASAASGTKLNVSVGTVATGSPLGYGRTVLTGTGTTSAGSALWVVFGNTFAAAPHFVANAAGAAAVAVSGSPSLTGSALITSAGGSVPVSWIAVGSGLL